MNLENMREEFPEMPENMRTMIEREVASQISVETHSAARLDGAKAEHPQKNRSRSTGRKKAGKTFLLVAAALPPSCVRPWRLVLPFERGFLQRQKETME